MSTWSWLRGLFGRSGARRVTYAPRRNGRADPGEIVWAAVPFEDRPGEAKDRPVLIVGRRDRATVLGLQLSTQERRAHQDGWLPLGKGPWDRQGRDSFVRLDRVLELRPDSIRREGAVLDEARFRYISSALRARHGWE
ncbi:MAG: type II toxin-antitoxin system PemK/MazF family toxin [Frankiaceae bacterium]|nr:type II toxin-antitoxin system PemK/MazF family toxin [Frankiaceae bacterium]